MNTVYKPRKSYQYSAIAFGLLFVVIGAALIIVVPLLMGTTEFSGQGGQQGTLGVIGAGVLFILIGGGLALFMGRLSVLHLTADALEQRRRGKLVASFPYHEISAVRMVLKSGGRGRTSLATVLEGPFERPLQLMIRYQGRAQFRQPMLNIVIKRRVRSVARYDAQDVLQALLPRLPDAAEIDPLVRTYADYRPFARLAGRIAFQVGVTATVASFGCW